MGKRPSCLVQPRGIPADSGTDVALPDSVEPAARLADFVRARTASTLAICALLATAGSAQARNAGDPITLRFEEGDLVGLQTVFAEGGDDAIGTIEFRQHRKGDELETLRIARFSDGSSDEELAIARVADGRLEALRGHQIMRDVSGQTTVQIDIDVVGDRVRASWGSSDDRKTMDEKVDLPPGTYWGPLVFIVLKNFAANEENGRLVFHTVAPTPRPRMIDLELVRERGEKLERPGFTLTTERFHLRPTVHWTLDPILAVLLPDTSFWTVPGEPPGLALFEGPRNFGGQRIVLR
jgi:hypothetical protein